MYTPKMYLALEKNMYLTIEGRLDSAFTSGLEGAVADGALYLGSPIIELVGHLATNARSTTPGTHTIFTRRTLNIVPKINQKIHCTVFFKEFSRLPYTFP